MPETTERQANGRFKTGCKPGPGSPVASRQQSLKAVFLKAVTKQDILDITAQLIQSAKEGSIPAAREVFDRVFGKAQQTINVQGGGLFSSIEQRNILIQLLSDGTTNHTQLADALANEGSVPNPSPYQAIRAISPQLVQGQLPPQCPNPVSDTPREIPVLELSPPPLASPNLPGT